MKNNSLQMYLTIIKTLIFALKVKIGLSYLRPQI